MEVGQQVTDADERARAMSTTHDVPIRTATAPQSTRGYEGSSRSSTLSTAQPVARPTSGEVWTGALSRLQTQVSLNTGFLDSHRRKVQEIEAALLNVERVAGEAMATAQGVLAELRAGAGRPRFEADDLDVLKDEVSVLSGRVNEVDALRLHVRLLENRLKRQEERGSPSDADARPGSGMVHGEARFREPSASSQTFVGSHSTGLPSTHHPLPPMRTSANMSPAESRPAQYTPSDIRQPSMDSPATLPASSLGGFRPGEPLPPPSALPGWRQSAEPAASTIAASLAPPLGVGRPPVAGEAHSSGWAAVNAAPNPKRRLDEPRQSTHDPLASASPKRPRLAPIMPRGTYSEESSYVPSSVPTSSVTDLYRGHSRVPSDGSQPYQLQTPASANIPGRRFIISTQSADSEESWKPESERPMPQGPHGHPHGPHGHGPGRRGGRGGRARARGARGNRGGISIDAHELGTPDWERADWTGSQISSNGFYYPTHHRPRSPGETSRGGAVQDVAGTANAPSEREAEFPATPLAVQGPYDPFTIGYPDSAGGQQGSGGKKTRKKPIRNSEGVLIRKDGRPDMRSVSSANNLRKVHAKKEAERAEMDGRTPTSARSLAPAGSMSGDEAESLSESPEASARGDDTMAAQSDAQGRHRELMSRMFPSGSDEVSRGATERFLPSHQEVSETQTSQTLTGDRSRETAETDQDRTGQMTDVEMRESADPQAEEHEAPIKTEDVRMPTVEEVNEEQEQERKQAREHT